MSSSEWQHCETLLSHHWTHRTSPQGWTPPSQIFPITTQRRSAYDNDSFRCVMTGAESEQPVWVPCYQWVGCRDHAGITCFLQSRSWQAQGAVYICRDQRKHVFHNVGPFRVNHLYKQTFPYKSKIFVPPLTYSCVYASRLFWEYLQYLPVICITKCTDILLSQSGLFNR